MTDAPLVRACPHCHKEISAKATRCKHCLERVDSIVPAPSSNIISESRHEPAAERMTRPLITPAAPSVSSWRCEYRYLVVPFIGTMRAGLFSSDNAQTVSAQLQRLVDHYAQEGWEFYSLEKVDIQVNPGCIGQLLGQSASYITFDQVIFRQGA